MSKTCGPTLKVAWLDHANFLLSCVNLKNNIKLRYSFRIFLRFILSHTYLHLYGDLAEKKKKLLLCFEWYAYKCFQVIKNGP